MRNVMYSLSVSLLGSVLLAEDPGKELILCRSSTTDQFNLSAAFEEAS